jgi:hypothetical protein
MYLEEVYSFVSARFFSFLGGRAKPSEVGGRQAVSPRFKAGGVRSDHRGDHEAAASDQKGGGRFTDDADCSDDDRHGYAASAIRLTRATRARASSA